MLRNRAEELPPTESVDIMIGRANVRLSLSSLLFHFAIHFASHVGHMLISPVQYLSYIETLAEIANWDADGKMHGECKAVARRLSETFKERLETIGPR